MLRFCARAAGTRICARNRHRFVLLLARCRGHMVVHVLRRRKNWTNRWRNLVGLLRWLGFEAVLLHIGCGALYPDRRSLKLERLRWRRSTTQFGVKRDILDTVATDVVEAILDIRSLGVVVHWRLPASITRRERPARSVGSGLGTKLSEVEIRAGFVPGRHRLAELAFGVEAVEDNGVNGNSDGLDDDFNDGADKGPVLMIMSERILE